MSTLVTNHNAGFFSCCNYKLCNLISFIHDNKKLPEKVDSSAQFEWYKQNKHVDITFDYFENYENVSCEKTTFEHYGHYYDYQYDDYSKIRYEDICPFVKKYFSPSAEIVKKIEFLEEKYNMDYNNICVLFYRGNDKNRETQLCGYEEYLEKAKLILHKHPGIQFWIQSDETEFIEYMSSVFPNNSIWFKDEIRHVRKCNSTVDLLMPETNYEFSKYYLAITILMSKCKYIVCGSGNCSLWIMFYRGCAKNIFQNLTGYWIDNIVDES